MAGPSGSSSPGRASTGCSAALGGESLREADLVPPAVRFLTSRGDRVWRDPDGTDYLDLVALSPREGVGLIELKLRDPRRLVGQALKRRTLGDWVAVGLPRESLARRAVQLAQGVLSRRVGVWVVSEDGVKVLRASRPLVEPGEPDVYAESRGRFRALVEQVERGTVPPGVLWGDVRGFRERRAAGRYRLDEFPSGG
jgi:hypothetical protein